MDKDANKAEFVRRLKDLFDLNFEKCRSLDENKEEIICKYCNHKYCHCDECSFHHMILCSLADCKTYATDSEVFFLFFFLLILL